MAIKWLAKRGRRGKRIHYGSSVACLPFDWVTIVHRTNGLQSLVMHYVRQIFVTKEGRLVAIPLRKTRTRKKYLFIKKLMKVFKLKKVCFHCTQVVSNITMQKLRWCSLLTHFSKCMRLASSSCCTCSCNVLLSVWTATYGAAKANTLDMGWHIPYASSYPSRQRILPVALRAPLKTYGIRAQ